MIERLVRLYQTSSDERSVAALLIANFIPLAGVLFFGWNLATILVIYWLENGIVGIWNVPRMILAGRGSPATQSRTTPTPLIGGTGATVFFVLFFLLHYGLFWFVHGVFVFALTTGFGDLFGSVVSPVFVTDSGFGVPDVAVISTGPVWSQVWLAAAALFVSHGLSFFLDYVRGGEYKTTSVAVQMFQPYGRVVVMHVTIIIGAILTFALGSPIGLLIVLVVLKTALDLGLHARRHPLVTVSGVGGPFG